jgi:cobyrinic acid a,c-diamide synthase
MNLSSSPARLVIAGVASGVGKTMIATGLMAAMAAQGLRVQGYKVGPDYIDPTYHRAATGRVSYNLDTWLSSPALVRRRFEAGMRNADVAIIEGVMGLFDGRKQTLGTASTAEVAKLLNAPVLLVLDASHMGQSAAAIVYGFQHVDPAINIAGVIVNKVASAEHEATVRLAIAEWTGVPVLGVLRRDASLTLPARHLGLIPITETPVEVEKLGAALTDAVDLAGILRLAREAGSLPSVEQAQERHRSVRSLHASTSVPVARMGLALDNAFSFYYPETLETFEQMGVEVVPFSPLTDSELPNDLNLLYFGGGFPEVFAAQLADNQLMLASVRAAAQQGILIYAECGGYMYLGKRCVDAHHTSHDLVGILPYTFQMGTERAQLGYRELTTLRETIIGPAGTHLRGHEFHWSHIVEPLLEERVPYQIEGSGKAKEGYATETVLASYVHVPLAANPEAMAELIRRCVLHGGAQKGGIECAPH